MHHFNAPLRAYLQVGTSTLWKVFEYSAIAAANFSQQLIRLDHLNDSTDVHSAVENKPTADQNLVLKFADVDKSASPFRRHGQQHVAFLKTLRRRMILFARGEEKAMDDSYIMADDTTFAIPAVLWRKMLPALRKAVVPGSLKASECSFKGDPVKYMSVADIGPITGAIGQKEFWELVRHTAARTKKYKDGAPIRVYHQISCAITRLEDAQDTPVDRLKAHTLLHVFAPNGLMGETPTTSLIPTTEDYVCLPENPSVPVAADYANFLLNASTRRQIYDQFTAIVMRHQGATQKASMTAGFKAAKGAFRARPSKTLKKHLKLVGPACLPLSYAPAEQPSIAGLPLHLRSFPTQSLDDPDFLAATAMEFDFGKRNMGRIVYEPPDAIIFTPFDSSDADACAYNYLKLHEALVARPTDRRFHHVPIVIMNYKGCYDPAIFTHLSYANRGYNKESLRHAVHDRLSSGETIVTTKNIRHLALFNADIINEGSLLDQYSAADTIVRFRLINYYRTETERVATVVRGSRNPDGLCVATVFASASSDKLVDYMNGEAIGALIAKLGMGLLTGGGDEHAMYAPIVGYNAIRQKDFTARKRFFLACVSTHAMVQIETAHSRLPLCDYSELHPTIAPRLQTLLTLGDLYISIGGGNGTNQETGHVYLANKKRCAEGIPPKAMIFVGRDISMHREIESLVGKRNFERLIADPYALQSEGLYLFPDAKSAAPLIRSIHASHIHDRARSPLPPRYPRFKKASGYRVA